MKPVIALMSLIFACFLLPGNATAGCNINVGVKNANASPIDVKLKLFSAVKTKNGAWRNLHAGHWGPYGDDYVKRLEPNQTYKDNYAATFGCRKNRQYRIRYDCGGGSSVTTYYPSGTSFTKKTSLVIRLDGC